MAHAPAVGYNAQRAAPAAARTAPVAPAAAPAASSAAAAPIAKSPARSRPPLVGRSSTKPVVDLSSLQVPGDTWLEKGFVVLAILIIGFGLYSKLTGKPLKFNLQGFTVQGRAPASPAAKYYAQQDRRVAMATDTMFTRMNLANPARVMT